MNQIPNAITVIRILLTVPIAAALMSGQLATALLLFAIAAFTDALDGFLARRCGWQSELGSILDPVADKVLLAAVFVSLAVLGLVPRWLMVTALARDAIIILGASAYRLFIGPLTAQPSVVSKLNTLSQAAFLLLVVVRAIFAEPAPWTETALGAFVFATTVVSGIDYVITYAWRAVEAAGTRQPQNGNGQQA